jgi:hypothetical protein
LKGQLEKLIMLRSAAYEKGEGKKQERERKKEMKTRQAV